MCSFTNRRPPESARRFHSDSVERLIADITARIADPELAWLFGNCFPNTLDTTIFHTVDANGRPDTHVITGDIDAMWLRDSAAQVWPFLPLTGTDLPLRTMIAGVINRQSRFIVLDPYANAFQRDASEISHWAKHDQPPLRPGVHERKWELDSLAYFLRLSHGYWHACGDTSPFDTTWLQALRTAFATIREQQACGDEPARSAYRFERLTGDIKGSHSCRVKSLACGLVRCSFRPSDDMVELPFLVPANAMLSVALAAIAPLLENLGATGEASEARTQARLIRSALEQHAVTRHPEHGEIWAYETDGYGNHLLMDDANAPSLLSLPYLGFCAIDDPRYLRTRAFVLSPANPYFARGPGASGIGSPHTGRGTIWPMALIIQALTSPDEAEITRCLQALKSTHAGTGFMHESFHANDAGQFTRPWFAWANTLFGELIATVARTRAHLLT